MKMGMMVCFSPELFEECFSFGIPGKSIDSLTNCLV